MATADPVQSLQEIATCSICLEYYTDPVSTECGHNFCRSCITQYWDGSDRHTICPQCRAPSSKGNLRHNRQLQNMVEITKQLPLPAARTLENTCEKHEEKLKIFCRDDQKAICMVCSISADHRSHTVTPIDEAALEYMSKLQDWLPCLRKEMERIAASRLKEEERFIAMRDNLKAERCKFVAEFKQLHEFLKAEEKMLLGKMGEMYKEVKKAQHDNLARLSNQITSLDALITEIEEKCKQPVEELLKDVRTTLNRCENVKCLQPEKEMKNCKGKENTFENVKIQNSEDEMKKYKVAVTLDPETVNQWLTLSEDGRRVRWGNTAQTLPDNHQRFTYYPCVLGSEGFTSGRHYWEVQLQAEGDGWHVGAARESVNREEWDTESPEMGVWAVKGYDGHYKAITSPPSSISICERPRMLGVYLDYEGGRLSLHNGDTMEHLYTFTIATLTERIFPFFWLGYRAELHLV